MERPDDLEERVEDDPRFVVMAPWALRRHLGLMAKSLFGTPLVGSQGSETFQVRFPGDGEAYGSEDGRRVGERIFEEIDDALATKTEEGRVRRLGECVRRFPQETLRHPEVCIYLEHLERRRNTAAITRILQDRSRRGRPPVTAADEFVETAIIEGIIHRDGCSANRAAEVALREHRELLGHKSARSIANHYSRTHETYRLMTESRWIPGDKLTEAPWSRSSGSSSK